VITIADALASEMSLQIRQTVSRHRRQKQSLERAGSLQSRRGLDWMNFFTADVQTGFGAFVSLYLAELQWSQQSVGFALTIGRISGVIGMIPAGALADSIRSKARIGGSRTPDPAADAEPIRRLPIDADGAAVLGCRWNWRYRLV
jgi:hypothetical protein